MSLYGTRDAAQNWEEEYCETLIAMGFSRGLSSPCAFYHKQHNLRLVVHGDDFTSIGSAEQLEWFAQQLASFWEVKVRATLGPEESDDKEVRILNRTVKWEDWGISYEADQRHAELIVQEMGMQEL